jgi:DNA-binding SARP family transcriptional activator
MSRLCVSPAGPVSPPATAPAAVSFHILGPLEARDGRRQLDLGAFKQRALLAALLCQPNSVVPTGALVDVLWADCPPRTATKNVQVYVSQLRRTAFGGTPGPALAYRFPGYQVSVGPAELDLLQFKELARDGRLSLRAGEPERAAVVLRQALGLWRGPALADMAATGRLVPESGRLDDRRLAAYEDWFEAMLALRCEADALDELEELSRAHPVRERLRSLQMTALFRAGRQAEALAVFDEVRQHLARELGLPPTPALRWLYQAILTGGAALGSSVAGPASLGPPPAVRLHEAAVAKPVSLLPAAARDFTGRAGQLAQVSAALGRGEAGSRFGPVVVHGFPGTGKTTLAVQVAHRLGDAFPDGRVLVNLRADGGRARPLGAIRAELRGAFGLTGDAGPAGTARAAEAARAAGAAEVDGEPGDLVLRRRLSDRRILVVLDDAVDEAQVRRLLPDLGDSAVLVTSRRLLGGLESAGRLELPPFTVAEAVDLLDRSLGEGRVHAEPDAARQVAQACQLLPLAVRIVATKLAARRHLPLGRYAQRLADGQLLDELSIGDLSVGTRLETFVRDLAGDERRLLTLLGTRPQPRVGLDELAAAVALGPAAVEPVLDRLIQAHAVVESPVGDRPGDGLDDGLDDGLGDGVDDGPRYEVPTLLRQYLRGHRRTGPGAGGDGGLAVGEGGSIPRPNRRPCRCA